MTKCFRFPKIAHLMSLRQISIEVCLISQTEMILQRSSHHHYAGTKKMMMTLLLLLLRITTQNYWIFDKSWELFSREPYFVCVLRIPQSITIKACTILPPSFFTCILITNYLTSFLVWFRSTKTTIKTLPPLLLHHHHHCYKQQIFFLKSIRIYSKI